ncbi:SigE family RNA polymerase sigma factor [Streptomyces chumphonensis]|uniref:SigE family RNA polymerase sigma factor n=1 Tax=Streptomyces chumphonensis TaxID=1214925 RepID=A0A927IDG6_9ACTN|nr:SigE family RNA polymerase sigma factor [Streptomyces chumphonensis]MBD3932281.1 SigE family RNA polymerase sigma factor [Streptomyces chumphonensis]
MTALRELRGHTGTTASSAGNGSTVLHTRRHTSSVPAQRNNGQSTAQHGAVTHLTAENPGAVSGRGCARGTGRRPAHLTPVPAEAAPAKAAPAPRAPVSARSEAEFTEYVRQRRAALYATAFHLTGDRFEAEDLLQSALFSTYRAWDRISDKAAVGGYLRRTMTNLHISAWRRRKLNEYPTEELPETPSTGDVDAMRGTELRAVLWQALARLPEPQRTMLVLRYYEGRTDPEIADILGISVGTVKSSIWRSLRRLRDDEVLARGRDEQECFGELVA